MLDRTFRPPAKAPTPEVFEPQPDDPRVVLELEPAGRWVAERYPVETAEELADGRLRVSLVVSERAWLERLLLRLGPAAMVVEGDSDLLAGAARRVLARYAGTVPA